MGFGSVFSFALIALASTADAYLLVTLRYCIRVDDLPLCPGPTRQVGTQFRIESGYAPGSGKIEKLRPKWDDTFEINDSDPNALLEFGLDYCLVKKTVGGYDRHGCALACYQGDVTRNPYYVTNFGGRTPLYSDPVAGQTGRNIPITPNNCPNPNGPLTDAAPVQNPIPGDAMAFNAADDGGDGGVNADLLSFNTVGSNIDSQLLTPAVPPTDFNHPINAPSDNAAFVLPSLSDPSTQTAAKSEFGTWNI